MIAEASGRLILVAGLTALGSATALHAQGSAEEGPWDFVEFEVKSWGAPMSSWRILPNGGGSWTESVREDGQPPNVPAAQAWHEIEPEVSNYTGLETILQRLPRSAGSSLLPVAAGTQRFQSQ